MGPEPDENGERSSNGVRPIFLMSLGMRVGRIFRRRPHTAPRYHDVTRVEANKTQPELRNTNRVRREKHVAWVLGR